MIRYYRNEVGHDVTIDIHTKEVNGIECIQMNMEGPDSTTEWEVTKGEAQALYEVLGSVLGWKK